MKLIITIATWMFVVANCAFSQGKLVEKTVFQYNPDTSEKDTLHREINTYDESENPILFERYSRDFLGVYDLRERINTTYGEDSIRVETFYYNSVIDSFIPKSELTKWLDGNGCVIETLFYQFEVFNTDFPTEVYIRTKYKYDSNSTDCLVIEETKEKFLVGPQDDFLFETKFNYVYENDNKTINLEEFEWNINLEDWELAWNSVINLDDEGRELDQVWIKNSEPPVYFYYVWDYDNHGNLISYTEQKEKVGEAIENLLSHQYQYEYDDQSFITHVEFEHETPNHNSMYRYDRLNYCDGKEKHRKELEENSQIIEETTFRYLHGTECEDSESDGQLLLFPNPANDFLTIESNLLSHAAATVEIFNITGQKWLDIPVPNQTPSIRIPVKNLPKGSYIVRIKTPKNVSTKQFLRLE